MVFGRMKFTLLIILGIVLTLNLVSADCTGSAVSQIKPGETLVVSWQCSLGNEKGQTYTVAYYNITSSAEPIIGQNSTGTTPIVANQFFDTLLTIPSGFNVSHNITANLTGTNLEGGVSVEVVSTGANDLVITSPLIGGKWVGLVTSVKATVKDENGKKVNGGNCRFSVWSNDETTMLKSGIAPMFNGELKFEWNLDSSDFQEGTDYKVLLSCFCGGNNTVNECIDEDGITIGYSVGAVTSSFKTNTWLTVNTLTDRSIYIMKNEIVVCANVTNVNRSERIPLNIYHQIRCSSGTDNEGDLDRTLIIDDNEEPDDGGIDNGTTQMQCKRFHIPESEYLQGRTSECYASTNVWILNSLKHEILGYFTTSPTFNITSTELNLIPDWQRISEYNWNTIINLSTESYIDWNGSGIGNIDLKLNLIQTSIKSSEQYGERAISIESFIMTQYIKNITAKHLNGTNINYNFEILDDGSIEIELIGVDISPSGWYNVSLEFNQFYERQANALEGIEEKTGTFHLEINCDDEGIIEQQIECDIFAQVESSQLVEKEVDFTCYLITNDGSRFSETNWNKMITRILSTTTRSFNIPGSFVEDKQYVVQCQAGYYNLGSRNETDFFYDTFTARRARTLDFASDSGIEKLIPEGDEEPERDIIINKIKKHIIETISGENRYWIFYLLVISGICYFTFGGGLTKKTKEEVENA